MTVLAADFPKASLRRPSIHPLKQSLSYTEAELQLRSVDTPSCPLGRSVLFLLLQVAEDSGHNWLTAQGEFEPAAQHRLTVFTQHCNRHICRQEILLAASSQSII